MTLLIVYFSLAIAISFLCSMLEAALLSVTPSYLLSEEEKGKSYASTVKALKDNVDRPLSAILSFNTIAHTVGAAGVGAQAVAIWGEAYFGVISAVLTVAILVLSEIIPKSLGANYWKQIVPWMGVVLTGMIYLLYPLVIFSQFLTKAFSKGEGQSTSREEVAALTNLGVQEGVFEENESKIIHNLIRFKSIRVSSVMTPRTVVLAIEESQTLKELFEIKKTMRFSRIPVYRESIDDIRGYVLKFDILDKLANDEFDHTIKELTREMTDRKSTRLNSSHVKISYAVFCLKKKKLDSDQIQERKFDPVISPLLDAKTRTIRDRAISRLVDSIGTASSRIYTGISTLCVLVAA